MLLPRISAATLALVCAAALGACDDDDDPLGIGDEDTTVRFLNATNFNFDVAHEGAVATGAANIAFGAASSCIEVDNDDPELSIRPTGTTTNLSGFAPTFQEGRTYTVLVSGTASAPVFTLLDDSFTAPGANQALVRIINATSSATTGTGTWDIFLNPGTTLGTPAASGVGRNAASAYLTVPSGQANTIRLQAAGQTGSAGLVQNLSVPSLTAGTVRTIVVTDAATGSTTLRTFNLDPCPTT